MFTNRKQKWSWMIAFAALLVTGSLIVGASTMPPVDELQKIAQGPVLAVVWLITPAIVIIGSIVGGLLFHAISKLWQSKRETPRSPPDRRNLHLPPAMAGNGVRFHQDVTQRKSCRDRRRISGTPRSRTARAPRTLARLMYSLTIKGICITLCSWYVPRYGDRSEGTRAFGPIGMFDEK